MRCLPFLLVLSTFLALTSATAYARVIPRLDFCQGGLFPQENQPLGLGVAGPGGAHVYYDKESCLLEGPRCRTAHVPPGEQLLLGRHRDDLVCIYFSNGHATITGWVKSSTVRPQPIDHNPPLSAWLGLWIWDGNPDGDPYVRFRLRKGVLRVKGESWTVGPAVHIGGLDEQVQRKGWQIYDAMCNVTFQLIGHLVVALEPDVGCTSPGAEFDGVYSYATRNNM